MTRWLTRYNPSEPLPLRRALDQLLEDSIVGSPGLGAMSAADWPALDIYETDDEIVVKAAMPGIKPDDVHITMTGQNLTIRGEMQSEDEVKEEQYLYRERRVGSFGRSIELPTRVQGDQADASFDDGVLTLRIPKAEEIKPRQIRISARNGGKSESAG